MRPTTSPPRTVRGPRARWTLGVAALLALTLGCAGCGDTAFRFSVRAGTPASISTARAHCPATPRLTSGNPKTLVPGHPTGALICRYSSRCPCSRRSPLRLAGAVEVENQDVVDHMVGELNALPPPGRIARSCPESPGHSSLIVFRYQSAGQGKVLINYNGCVNVSNGELERWGPLHRIDETYWPDEGML
jgi:hypothetical protein